MKDVIGSMAFAAVMLFSSTGEAASPSLPCRATPEREAIAIPTPDGEQPFDESVFAVLKAGDDFSQPLPHGWQFALLAQEHGWALRVFDRQQSAGRVDLSAITPPYHGPANARDIAGWHFRNAANTGANTGDVNAPQDLRLFQFSVGLIGTGGFRAPGPADAASPPTPDPGEGRGWLRILDSTLSGLEPGQRASMQSMRFQACLTWPRPTEEQALEWELQREAAQRAADALSPTYLPEEREEIGSCGLDPKRYALDARILPRKLTFDIDADGAADALYQIRRNLDGARMLALCRAGTYLTLLGPDHSTLQNENVAHIVRALEKWQVVDGGHGPFGYVDEPAWPRAEGDVLVLERIEKGMALFYWQHGALLSQSVYRFVEP